MAYTTINKPSQYFNTKLYTGNGGTQSVTGVGFQPDFVWIKDRVAADYHWWTDAVRGATKTLHSNVTTAETTQSTSLTAFGSDGFTLGSDASVNRNGDTFVSWNWLGANTTVSNTSGTITSTVSANTTSGFSIVSYTGNGSAGATVGHGLGAAPKMMIHKDRTTGGYQWGIYTSALGATKNLNFTTGGANVSTTYYNDTAPTSTVFSLGTNVGYNANGDNYIAYCFAEIKGFSKAGSWTGNGNADGTFIYTGFKPAMIFHKRTDSTGDWRIWDNKRSNFNLVDKILYPSASNAEGTETFGDFVSNGFKIRTSGTDYNASGGTYIYMAFAENPFVSSTFIPTTAR